MEKFFNLEKKYKDFGFKTEKNLSVYSRNRIVKNWPEAEPDFRSHTVYNETINSAIGTEHPMNLTHNYSRKGAFRDIATIVRQRNNFKHKLII